MSYSKHKLTPTTPAIIKLALCLFFMTSAAAPLDAAIGNASYTLRISESEAYLADGSMKPLLGYESMYYRNTPFLELKNTSPNAALVEFRITIGDEAFHFGNGLFDDYVLLGRKSGSVPPGGLQLDSDVESDGDELVVSFLDGGLAPGELVRFQFDIDADANPTMGAPDYRNVLFDRSGFQQYGTSADGMSTSDNAHVTAEFFMAGMDPLSLGPFAFEDPEIPVGPYTDGRMFAPYSQSILVDPPAAFALGAPAITPEPTSWCLFVLALAGVAIVSRASRAHRRMAKAVVAVPGVNRG